MITENLTFDGHSVKVQNQGILVFMYSRAPLIISDPSEALASLDLRVTHVETGASFMESRRLYEGVVNFDLSAIMRYLAPDVTTVMDGQRGNCGASEYFEVQILYAESVIWSKYFYAIYGALNANESYRLRALDPKTPESRRLWVNYPQTFMLTQDVDDFHSFELSSGTKIWLRSDNPDHYSKEVDLIQALGEDSDSEALECLQNLKAGRPQLVGLSSFTYVNAQAESGNFDGPYWLNLLPDLTPAFAPGRTYLRWLQRDGSFGYWLFHSGEMQIVASEGSSFERFFVNPNAPSYFGSYVQFSNNARQTDFKESRTLNIGTTINSLQEFSYIEGLLTSPVVERYVLSGEGGNEQVGWERVNLLPSSQGYSRKRDTPRTRQIELTIQLPDRDTIKL